MGERGYEAARPGRRQAALSVHGPGFDRKVDGRHLSAQRAIAGVMYRAADAGRWTTHKEQAAELTSILGLSSTEAFETAAAGARMRSLRGKPADGKGGLGWILKRRRRKGSRAQEYILDLHGGESCPTCGGNGYTGEEGAEVGCAACGGTGRVATVTAPRGCRPATAEPKGQTTFEDWAAPKVTGAGTSARLTDRNACR